MVKLNSTKSYPLAWPVGTPRAATQKVAAFKDHSIVAAIQEIETQLDLLNAWEVVISTNIPVRVDGGFYTNPGKLTDAGAVVFFRFDGRKYCMPCDKWTKLEDNLWAIGKNINAMRDMRRWGVGSLEQAFAGFKALPSSVQENWWDVLGLDRNLSNEQDVQERFRILARTAHPDRNGGNDAPMTRLNVAREQALYELLHLATR